MASIYPTSPIWSNKSNLSFQIYLHLLGRASFDAPTPNMVGIGELSLEK